MEEQFYDDASIAARSKREQLLKEAEEHRLHCHIAAMRKHAKVEKVAIPENRRQFEVPSQAAHHPAPAH